MIFTILQLTFVNIILI